MIKKVLFFVLLFVMAIVLYTNPNFETIVAGIAILIFGMMMLEEGFKVFTKGPLQLLLKNSTDKLYKSITTGATINNSTIYSKCHKTWFGIEKRQRVIKLSIKINVKT